MDDPIRLAQLDRYPALRAAWAALLWDCGSEFWQFVFVQSVRRGIARVFERWEADHIRRPYFQRIRAGGQRDAVLGAGAAWRRREPAHRSADAAGLRHQPLRRQ